MLVFIWFICLHLKPALLTLVLGHIHTIWYFIDNTEKVISHLQKQWAEYSIKASMLRSMIGSYSSVTGLSVDHQSDMILSDYRRHTTHRPLLGRTTCSSLEDRKEYFAKRRRLDQYLGNSNTKTTLSGESCE